MTVNLTIWYEIKSHSGKYKFMYKRNESAVINDIFRKFGTSEDERIYAAVSIGYAATDDGMPIRRPLTRTGNPVTIIDFIF